MTSRTVWFAVAASLLAPQSLIGQPDGLAPAAITSAAGQAKPRTPIGIKDYYDRAQAHFNKKEYDEAFENFTRFLVLEAIYNETDSSIVSASHYYKGWIYNERKQYESAIRELGEAIKLDPKSVRNFNERAYSYQLLGNWLEVLGDLDRSFALDPKNIKTLVRRALAKFHLDQPSGALVDYDRAAKLNPRNAEALYGRGCMTLRLEATALGRTTLEALRATKVGGPSGDADIAAAKLLQADIAEVMGRLGIKPGS